MTEPYQPSILIAVDPGKTVGIAVFDMHERVFECVHCEERSLSTFEPTDMIDVFSTFGSRGLFVTEAQYVSVNIQVTMRLVEARAHWEFAARFAGREILPAIYANAWQVKLLGIRPGTKREERKERAQAWACRLMKRNHITEHAADAVCIGAYACMEQGWVAKP